MSLVKKEEIKNIASAVSEAMRRKRVRPSHVADVSEVHRSQFTRFLQGQRGIGNEKLTKVFRFLSITETDLISHGVSEGAIRAIFGFVGHEITIGMELTKVEGAWIYKTLNGEIVFAQGSPRAIIKKMILEDISNRLDLFLDRNFID